MDRRSLYDEDVYAWAQQQADALRRLAETPHDLPNELDLENVAEEIEDVGKSELGKVESFIELILVHLIQAASVPNADPYRKWGKEVRLFQAQLLKNLTRSMRAKVDMDELWRLARLRADIDLTGAGDELLAELPAASPFALDDLTAPEFDFEAALARVKPPQ
jgi:hypothetical protein